MTFLDDLAEAVESPTSAWHQFVVAHNPTLDDWYVFLEGKLDVPFYLSAIKGRLGGRARVVEFRCGGKHGVQSARRQVRESHPRCDRCLFFVDKDLQDFESAPATTDVDTFVTEVYSIENYLVTVEALNAVWTYLWSLASADPRRAMICTKFENALGRFHRLMLPVMAWIVLARRAGKRPNVNNVNLGALLVVVDCVPRLRAAAFGELKRVTSCEFEPAFADLLRETRRLSQAPAKCVVRGKFELWFFCRFLESIFSTLRDSSGSKPEGSIQPFSESIARALIGKVEFPMILEGFITAALGRSKAGHCGHTGG
jgi:hypothetical protein